MKKVKQIRPNEFYIFKGRSNANSCFIEKLIHAKQFLIYANYFLRGYLKIYDYIITKDGWAMIVKIKRKEMILNSGQLEVEEIWRIVSERIRLFLSTFVRVTNNEKGRTGCLVHSGYERFYFERLGEAMEYIDKMRNQQIKLYSKKKKYRSLKTHYRISSAVAKGSIFLCSKDLRKKSFDRRVLGEVFDFIDLKKLLVQKMVFSTLSLHKTSFSSNLLIKNQNNSS